MTTQPTPPIEQADSSGSNACSDSPAWREEFDDDDNSIWEAPSPYHDDGDPICWRLRQRLFGNKIEWYEDHDAELMDCDSPETWASIEEAKAAIIIEHSSIIRICLDE